MLAGPRRPDPESERHQDQFSRFRPVEHPEPLPCRYRLRAQLDLRGEIDARRDDDEATEQRRHARLDTGHREDHDRGEYRGQRLRAAQHESRRRSMCSCPGHPHPPALRPCKTGIGRRRTRIPRPHPEHHAPRGRWVLWLRWIVRWRAAAESARSDAPAKADEYISAAFRAATNRTRAAIGERPGTDPCPDAAITRLGRGSAAADRRLAL